MLDARVARTQENRSDAELDEWTLCVNNTNEADGWVLLCASSSESDEGESCSNVPGESEPADAKLAASVSEWTPWQAAASKTKKADPTRAARKQQWRQRVADGLVPEPECLSGDCTGRKGKRCCSACVAATALRSRRSANSA